MTQTPSLKTQVLQVDGMDCGSCAKSIEASLLSLRGVMEATVSFATTKVKVSYDTKLLSEAEIINRITALGYTAKLSGAVKPHNHTHCCDSDHNHDHKQVEVASAKSLQVKVNGMDCGSCAKTIEVGLQQMAGVLDVSVNFANERLQLSYDPSVVSETAITDRIRGLGYTVGKNFEASSHRHTHDDDCQNHNHDHNHTHPVPKPSQNPAPTNWFFWISNRRGQSVILAGMGLVLGLLAQHLALPIWIARGFYGVGIVVAGYPIARAGLFELRLRRAETFGSIGR